MLLLPRLVLLLIQLLDLQWCLTDSNHHIAEVLKNNNTILRKMICRDGHAGMHVRSMHYNVKHEPGKEET